VTKLSAGFKSRNVRLVTNREQARSYVEMLFDAGIAAFDGEFDSARRALALTGTQAGYFYAQEFVAGNDHDTRVTIVGNRGFGFRRFNRPDDFRASGSGRIDWDPNAIDVETIRFGFRIARRLNAESIAMDVLRRDDELVVTEVSYTFEPWKILACPGHWVCEDDSTSLVWRNGPSSPEVAIFEDFVRTMSAARAARRSRPEGSRCAMT
jgi:glutathione synthase/RimK-type ligase-like ATP-grasp enzyme